MRVSRLTHRDLIRQRPAVSAGQSVTKSAEDAAPINSAWALVSVPK